MSASTAADPKQLIQELGIHVADELLLQSLTHRSYAYEHGGIPDNERLEFLGDSVLGRAVTLKLFHEFPDIQEGELANRRAGLVSTSALAKIARRIGLGTYLRLGKGEERTGGRDKDSLLADTTEALIGAHFLSVGDPESSHFVMSLIEPLFMEQLQSPDTIVDPKTWLQEYAATHHLNPPHYVVQGSGPDHDKIFRAEVFLNDTVVGVGEGSSKKQAELASAAQASMQLRPQTSSKEA